MKNVGTVTIVRGDDWIGVYEGGILRAQGHTLGVRDVLLALDIPFTQLVADEGFLERRGCLPTYLHDTVFAK